MYIHAYSFIRSQAGQNDIKIGHLPIVLDGDSLRVESRTSDQTQHLTVFDVIHLPPSYSRTSLPEYESPEVTTSRQTLLERKALLQSQLKANEGQKHILQGYSDSLKDGKMGEVTTETLEGFMDVYASRLGKMYEERKKLNKEIVEIETKVREMDEKKTREEEAKRAAGVTVVLLAEHDGPATLTLSYGAFAHSLLPTMGLLAHRFRFSIQSYDKHRGLVYTTSEPT